MGKGSVVRTDFCKYRVQRRSRHDLASYDAKLSAALEFLAPAARLPCGWYRTKATYDANYHRYRVSNYYLHPRAERAPTMLLPSSERNDLLKFPQ